MEDTTTQMKLLTGQLSQDLSERRQGARATSHYNAVEDNCSFYCYTESPQAPKNMCGEDGLLGISFEIKPSMVKKIVNKGNSWKLAKIATTAFGKYEAEILETGTNN